MIDQDLIKKSTEHAGSVIQKTEPAPLVLCNGILHHELLQKLKDYLESDNLAWRSETDTKHYTYHNKRNHITWDSDTVIEELHMVFENLTPMLNSRYNRDNEFMGLSVWHDQEGYLIERHSDNPDIDIAIQVFLTSGPKELGTIFAYNNEIIQIDYQENSGYINDNTTRIEHWMETPVPKNHTRYSIYARWKKRENQ